MASRLFGATPLSEPMLPYCQLDPKEHFSVKFYLKFFIQGNVFDNVVCKMAVICPDLNVLKTWHVWLCTTIYYCTKDRAYAYQWYVPW